MTTRRSATAVLAVLGGLRGLSTLRALRVLRGLRGLRGPAGQAGPIGLVTLSGTAASPAAAQPSYPTRPITLVVPYPPGGSNDVFARALGKRLSDLLRQPVLVDNRPGAGGAIGAGFVSKAAPDGYTLMLVSSSFTTGAAVQTSWPFDPVAGFTPIAMVARGPMIVTVANALPVKSMAELVALAKARPGQLNFASAGPGSVNQFATELLMDAAGLRMTHVPYKGMSQATVDLVAGHVDLLIASAPSIMQQVTAGKVRAIGITSSAPSALAPGLAPVAATVPDYAFHLWWCVAGPAGLPPDLTGRLNDAIDRILQEPDTMAFFAREGTEPWRLSPSQTAALIRTEIATWKKVAARAGIKAE